jgi:hypothetical protein
MWPRTAARSIKSKQGNNMKKTRPAAVMAAVVTCAVLASAGAHAQSQPTTSWRLGQHKEPDPAKRLPEATRQAPIVETTQPVVYLQAPTVEAAQPEMHPQPAAVPPQAYAAEQHVPVRDEESRGGFFVGVQGGKGQVYDDIDQSALSINAGYRWQAGPVSLIGIEVAGGRLDSTDEDGLRYGKIEYGSIGANARFNFGRTSPVYGLVRTGYWAADDSDSGMDVDGAYFGLGLGVDINRHFNVSLVYTNYVYFEDYYWEGDDFYYDINRADTLMFGAEFRF